MSTQNPPSRWHVSHRWLYGAAALLWAGAGLMLLARAVVWLTAADPTDAAPYALGGLAAGLVLYRFKFTWLAARNIRRIQALPQRAHVLRFQSLSTYILIALMMGLGIALRRSSLSRLTLSVLYTGIGVGLLGASAHYARRALVVEATAHLQAAD